MQKFSFLHALALIAINSALISCLSGCTNEEVNRFLSGDGASSAASISSSSTSQAAASTSSATAASSSAAASQAASSSTAASSAAASVSAASSSTAASTAAASTPTSAASPAASAASAEPADTASAPAASAAPAESDCDAQIAAKIAELEALQVQANADLSAIIATARSEYRALPASQKGTLKKISIVYSHVGDLTEMQNRYDRLVADIVAEMRTILRANGRSEEQADAAAATYEQAKADMIASLRAQVGL